MNSSWFAWVSFSKGLNEARVRKELKAYLRFCSQVDHAIGTIIQGLKKSGQDRTVQGNSFCRILDGKKQELRTSALTENPYRKALATKEWRYIANIDGQKDEDGQADLINDGETNPYW